MLSCFDIANYFIWSANKRGIKVYTMTIHKNVYIAQAEYLAIYNRPLFEEDFQAWVWGPVIPEIFRQYKSYDSKKPISSNVQRPDISSEIATFLDSISRAFIDVHRFTLSELTHEEGSPWDVIRGNLEADEKSQEIIPKDLIKDYYQQVLLDDENREDLKNVNKFIDFLVKDSQNNPQKLVPYTEEMLKQDRQLLDSIFS